MQVVVLAGGLATRMRPLSDLLPKSLFPVAGRPFLDHQLNRLAASGATSVLLCLGHQAGAIVDHVSKNPAPLSVSWIVEPEPGRGTAGALVYAHAQNALEPTFMVTYGDSYLPIDLRPMWLRHQATHAAATMAVHRSPQRQLSNCQLQGQHVVRYEKFEPPAMPPPEMQHIDFGITALTRDEVVTWTEAANTHPILDLSAPLGELARRHGLWAYEVHTPYFEIGSPEGLRALEQHLAGGTA